jgi:uncharacterized membrane protein
MDEQQAVPSAPPPAAHVDTGLADNVAGALAYITVIPAILFLLIEPYSKRPFVKFNAFQCICLAVVGIVLYPIDVVLLFIPILGWAMILLIWLTMLVMVVMCIVKAYNGVKFKIPVLGNFAEKFAQ